MNFKEYITESEIKLYPIQVPPTDKEACVKIMLSDPEMAKGPWINNVNGKDVEIPAEEAIRDMDLKTLRHETVHALQHKNTPEIFKGLGELTHQFGSSESYKMKHYYNRPPEIMAYAFDTSIGVEAQKNLNIYKKIGGEVYNAFLYYLREYKK